LPRHNPAVVLHGDFWPGNILWKDKQLVAVIDWEDAALGDPLADVANSRLEILGAYGTEAMQQFTHYYQSTMPIDVRNLPCWDLCVALKMGIHISQWGLDARTERILRERHKWFVAQAFARLDA
jgi:aminoglycoside phosphotransferase (APT) family kinase protein